MKDEIKQNEATKCFDNFVEENKTEILIHKTILKIACQNQS